jgi:hypothetical protein
MAAKNVTKMQKNARNAKIITLILSKIPGVVTRLIVDKNK